MRAICVDDEHILMEDTAAMCREIPLIDEVRGFVSAGTALEWLSENPVDLALLDIDMPDMNGLELAARIKEISPDTAIIFITGYSEYAKDAFAVRASGYLMKPVTYDKLAEDIEYALAPRSAPKPRRTEIRTFGAFDVFRDGRPVKFSIAKSKELLAYLVDRQGGSVTRAEISSALWEDRLYDRKQQKQLDVYIRALKDTLAKYGILEIFEMHRGGLRVVPEKFVCDAYRFFAGEIDAVNAFRGEYMSSYSWASITEGIMYQKTERE